MGREFMRYTTVRALPPPPVSKTPPILAELAFNQVWILAVSDPTTPSQFKLYLRLLCAVQEAKVVDHLVLPKKTKKKRIRRRRPAAVARREDLPIAAVSGE